MQKEKSWGYRYCALSAGYTLLEVLIALCILSVGLLLLAQAQLLALRNNQTAYFQTIAALQLASMADRLTACAAVHCDSAGLTNEVSLWNGENSELLPIGKGGVSGKKIILEWQALLGATKLILYTK